MRSLSCVIFLLFFSFSSFAQSPHGDKLKIDCADCHEPTDWKIIPKEIKFDHNSATSFKLSGRHTSVTCISCHKNPVFSEVKSQCVSCHNDIHQNTLGPDCSRCHSPASWIVSNIIQIHQSSRFPLVGAHVNVDCSNCHSGYTKLYFPPQNVSCYSCHQPQYNAAKNPDHAAAKFSTECQDCHSITSFVWASAKFDHSFFPLTGGHNIQNCFSCHTLGSNFKGLSTVCYSCHKNDYLSAKNPDHMLAKFSTNCQDCHTITTFVNATFNHGSTGFPLTGAHISVTCQQCHSAGYTNTPTDCFSCHTNTYNSAISPANHPSAGLPHTCQDCHNTSSWTVTTFNHTTTGFTLTGAHVTIDCQSCHKGTVTGLTTDCYSCHSKDYAGATDPNHVTQGYPHDCTQCHSTTSWSGATFDHNTTGFPLTGAHSSVQCAQCHSSGYTNTSTACFSCHANTYNTATSPANHPASGLPHTCQDCHNTTTWTISTFNHSTTGFTLTGAHTNLDCASCHKGTVTGLTTDCYSCHAKDFAGTNDPNHVAQGFSHDCSQCHSTSSWDDASFNHSITTFPLTGSHSTVTCKQCHTSGYVSTSTACYSCHTKTFNSAAIPVNHAASGLPHTCQDCHNTTVWTNSSFNHTTTGFTLTGAHTTIDCSLCHKGIVTGLTTDCYSCHNKDFASAVNPNHASQGFPHDCTQCHSSTSWSGSTFNHNTTGFLLTAGHSTAQCSQCHSSGYTNTSADCYSCHTNNYNTAAVPVNHLAIGLSHICQDCHNTTAWTTTTFNHTTTGFTLTGAHTTIDCSSCHKGTVKGLTTDCYSCHSKDYTGATDPNHSVQGFPHDCSQCHSTTSWSGSTFNHNTTGFPLTGSHSTVQCSQCHSSGYTNTSADCYSCHTNNYNTAVVPVNHLAIGLPRTCQDCHNTTTWTATSFNHTTTGFTLTGAHTTIDCSSCHKGTVIGLTTDCYSCHSKDYAGATDPNHSVQGFPHDCTQCHSTTSWSGSTFNHNTTGFPLTGTHSTVQCSQCHASGYVNTSADCYSCHSAGYNSAISPTNHTTAGLPHTCQDCHNTTAWTTTTFNHTTTGFTLTGAHITIDCSSCHKGTVTGLTTDCYSCHNKDYTGATDPNHSVQGFPHDCSQCHSTTSWSSATFDHNTTGFQLTAGHANLQCSQCHSSGYTNTSTVCYSCHTNTYNSATAPANHPASGLPHTCQDCHNTTAWTTTTFNHTTTGFTLTGAHTTIDCSSCHKGAVTGLTTDCYSCHTSTYNTAISPTNHPAAGLPHTCQDCHNTTSWTSTTFNHTTTGFTLTGAHITIDCSSCHKGTVTGLTTDCYSCHSKDYASATDPNHSVQGFPHDCSQCHSTTSWSGATFDHNTTGFQLTSGHANLQCAQCHSSGYNNTSPVCYNCHQTNYQSALNPGHAALALPTDCSTCHSTNPGWLNASFPIHNNYYLITGAHTSLTCDNCHNGNYNSAPTTCFGCHQNDYNATNNPAHRSAGFPTDCTQCHTQSAWKPSTFNHDAANFPIYSGTHAGRWTLCADCHTNFSNFAVFSCTTCHDHSQANTDPNHTEVRNYIYSATSCYTCHPSGRSN
jgi:hypothetical protein